MAGKSRRLDSDMTQGSIWRQLIEFSLPMMIGLIFQQLYNTVDTIVVGQFVGKEALAAVGTTSSIINMLVGFAAGLSTGSSVIISQCYGSRDHEGLHKAVHTSISITFILAVAFTALGVLGADTLLRLQSTPEDVFPDGQHHVVALGPFFVHVVDHFRGLLQVGAFDHGAVTRALYKAAQHRRVAAEISAQVVDMDALVLRLQFFHHLIAAVAAAVVHHDDFHVKGVVPIQQLFL